MAYLIRPIYIKVNKKLSKSLSAVVCIAIILIVILLPLGGIAGGIVNQSYGLLNNKNAVNFINNIGSFHLLSKFNINLNSLFEKGALFFISLFSSALSYIPSLIISVIVLVFGIYYILVNFDNLSTELKNYLPFQDKNKIAREIDESTKAIIHGAFLIAIIEFAIAVVGFYLSGVNSYFLPPLLIFFFAFIPGLGPTIIWITLAIYYAFTNNWATLVGVIITGLVLSIYVDTILRTKILGNSSKINPFIILIGILGGISLFGIFGFIIGPLVLIYSLKILREYFKK